MFSISYHIPSQWSNNHYASFKQISAHEVGTRGFRWQKMVANNRQKGAWSGLRTKLYTLIFATGLSQISLFLNVGSFQKMTPCIRSKVPGDPSRLDHAIPLARKCRYWGETRFSHDDTKVRFLARFKEWEQIHRRNGPQKSQRGESIPNSRRY